MSRSTASRAVGTSRTSCPGDGRLHGPTMELRRRLDFNRLGTRPQTNFASSCISSQSAAGQSGRQRSGLLPGTRRWAAGRTGTGQDCGCEWMGAAWVDMGGFGSAGMLEWGLAKFPPARVRIARRPLSLGERCGWRSSGCPLEGAWRWNEG